MAPQAQRKRPQFFKILPADLFINQMIPRKFHKHFPHKHRKTATLVSPNGKFWHVKITRIDRDIYFQKEGWLEFAKAQGLEKGYMLIFRYEGNMIFNVKIFDTTGCLKDYSLPTCTLPIWAPSLAPVCADAPIAPANASTLGPASVPVTSANAYPLGTTYAPVAPRNASALGLEGASVVPANASPLGTTCAPVAPINASPLGTTCAPVAPTNASALGLVGAPIVPTNASALGLVGAPVVPTNASAPGLATNTPVAPENITAPGPADASIAPANVNAPGPADARIAPAIARGPVPSCSRTQDGARNSTHGSAASVHSLASSPASSHEPAPSLSLVSIPGPALRRSYINIGESATDQALGVKCEESEMGISCNSFVKSRKLSNGKRQVKIKREIKDIDEESDGEILLPGDTLNKKRKFSHGKSKSVTRKENKPVSQKKVKKEKTREICPKSSSYTQFEKILTDAGLKNGLLSIPKSFCMNNGLVTARIIFLTRKVEGKGETLHKKWPVRFFLRPSEGQFRNGWKYFMEENGLKRGDKCNFRLVSKDTLLVSTESHKKHPRRIKEEIVQKREVSSKKKKLESFQKSKKIIAPKRKWRNRQNRTADKTETWTIVRPYHLAYNYMTLSRGFCIENMLTSKRKMILKDPKGKEWHIIYYLNGSKEGRFRGLEWEIFSMENGLKEGDKCNFKLVAEDTMLFHVDKE